ncbi:MAG: hypothetical protein C4551_00225 [Bacillota bacterium]|nr:MAG: hypothetical protein C4551_00225 [Bacillota bacterium]
MVMPSQSQIEFPLLLEIDAAGGEAEPKDLYARVADHLPELEREPLPPTRRWSDASAPSAIVGSLCEDNQLPADYYRQMTRPRQPDSGDGGRVLNPIAVGRTRRPLGEVSRQ